MSYTLASWESELMIKHKNNKNAAESLVLIVLSKCLSIKRYSESLFVKDYGHLRLNIHNYFHSISS